MKIKEIYVVCSHCKELILIMSNEINCAIFRHGAYKHNLQQIQSHETKENCDKLFSENKIYGCGKPFRLLEKNNEYIAEICDYI